MEGTSGIQATGLIADPIYHYIMMTDRVAGEETERDVIDTPWVQRLRRIFQLQSARWGVPLCGTYPLSAFPWDDAYSRSLLRTALSFPLPY